ncbi:global transcription factor [Cucumis melo var. makuwa]|uniref:Global transcription factor n=1 Tax=Cucumis melo var. makuwa TaxID=1194695 RepID=A0A5A7UXH4_CUCMM|nr:global transcription factor [Cucumis melo var. makuwa]TYK24804.1 global transcription factor [Cucumis melo var. makuwa]
MPSFPTQSTASESLVCFPDAMYCIGKASPDRLYLVALLRNRFADTILKAREKELEKIAKRNLAAGYRRRKAEAEVAAAARDNNDDGTDGDEL